MRPDIDVIVREVGLRDGLQIHPAFMPTERKLAWIQAEAAAGVSRDRGHLLRAAEADSAVRRCRGGRRDRALGIPGLTVSAADPESARRRARRGTGRAQAQFRHVGEPDPQPEERAPRARGVGRRLPAHRRTGARAAGLKAPPAHRRRPLDGARLLLRRPRSGGRRACATRWRSPRPAPTSSWWPTPSVTPIPRRCARCSRR